MIYKPQFDSPGSESVNKKYDRVPDVDSVFSVHPPTGVLPPDESMEFKITYAPPVVRPENKEVVFLVSGYPTNHIYLVLTLKFLEVKKKIATYCGNMKMFSGKSCFESTIDRLREN